MSIKLIITGATGLAGAQAVREALQHPSISQVTVLIRRPILPSHIVPADDPARTHKLKVLQHSDFNDYPPALLSQLAGHDAVLWDLGISSLGFKEADYDVITREYALAAARAFAGLGSAEKKFVMCYLSGAGTDQEDGKAWSMFGRVKGKAERQLALLDHPTLTTYSFRPGMIIPVEPIPEASRYQRFVHRFLTPVVRPLLKKQSIDTATLARGMIEAAVKGSSGMIPGWEGKGRVGNEGVFDNEEIKALAGGRV